MSAGGLPIPNPGIADAFPRPSSFPEVRTTKEMVPFFFTTSVDRSPFFLSPLFFLRLPGAKAVSFPGKLGDLFPFFLHRRRDESRSPLPLFYYLAISAAVDMK